MRLSVYRSGSAWLDAYADIASRKPILGFDQTPEWFDLYSQHIVSVSDNPLLVAVVDEGTSLPLLGAPLYSAVSNGLSIRRVAALSNYYTSLFQPILSVGERSLTDVVSCFISALDNGSIEWDELSLEPMAGDTSFIQEFRHLLTVNRYPYSISECFTNWYLEVGGQSYTAYEQSLPSKLKNTLKRKQRKLERELGYTIYIIQDDKDLDSRIADYEAVYQKSWKPEESHPQFIRSVIKSFVRKGWVRLGFMYIAGKPVAAQLWFVKDGIASIYKLSYDEQYTKYSVGTILTADMMRQVIDEDHVEWVDFLTGDDAYKKDWMSQQRKRYRISVYNKQSWRGWLLAFWNIKVKSVLGKCSW